MSTWEVPTFIGSLVPCAQGFAVGIYLLERMNDVVDVGRRSQQQMLFEPGSLFIAELLAIWTLDGAVVEAFGNRRKVGAEGLVGEQRLAVQRESVTARHRNSLGLQCGE